MSDATIGEQRVRVTFNPSQTGLVDSVKQKSAELIDICQSMKGDGAAVISGEKARLIALAQTAFEEAAMWAVKAATL